MNKIYVIKINLFLASALLFYSSGFSQQYSWKPKSNFAGGGRYGAIAFSIGAFGYMGGGQNAGNHLDDFWEYNPANDSWTQKSNMPVATEVAGCFAINGKGYMAGGFTASGHSADLYEFDPVNNSWASKASFIGTAMYGGAAFAIGTKGYYCCGNSGGGAGPYMPELYEYDPSLDTWTQLATFPGIPRYGTYGIALNGKGYAGFGYNQALGISFKDWWEYDPASNVWSSKDTIPGLSIAYPSGFTINNKIYVGTGIHFTNPVDAFYEYDPLIDDWVIKQNYPGGGHWVSAGFSIGNIGFIGTGSDGSAFLNDFYEYSPDSSTSLIKNNNSFSISVSPVPFNNHLLFKMYNSKNTTACIKLQSVNGKEIFNKTIAITNSTVSLENYLDLKSLNDGIYFLEVVSNGKTIGQKIIKTK